MEMEIKACPIEVKAMGEAGEYEGYFSVFRNVDDGGDSIEPGAFSKTISERGNRVQVLYAHDWSRLIGPPPAVLREDEFGLYAKGRFTLESFWGREAWALMRDGALKEGSFGYEAVKYDYDDDGNIRHLREVKLYEISPVPLGMNAMTEVRLIKAALVAAAKRAIPPHTSKMAPVGEEWDSAAALQDASGARQLRLAHAWVDDEGDPDAKSSYKLPHHLADGRVVWRGVAAAGAALMGSRGGVGIPEGDVAGVRRHLARHYEQFEKTPPWEESAGLDTYLETLEAITAELQGGRALCGASKESIRGALGAMQGALEALSELAASEPQKATGRDVLVRRLRAAEFALQGTGR